MTTTIGQNTRIDGRIEGDDDVVVIGRVDGSIALEATLTIAQGGFVTGDVAAPVVVVEGAVSGTVRASELVHLTATAQVEGELFAEALRMDAGAAIHGRVEMDVEAAPPMPKRTESRPRPTTSRASSTPAPDGEQAAPAPRPSAPTRTERTAPSRPAAPQRSAPAASTTTTVADPDDMTVKELREILKDHDLPVSGTKTELIDRIRELE